MALTYTKTRWNNNDGLSVYFPDAAGTPTRGGAVKAFGESIADVVVTLADLPALSSDANGLLLADNVRIPKGVFIDKVQVKVLKETAGSGSNLNIGLVKASDMSIFDADGLLAAADAFNAGTDVGTITTYTKSGSTGEGQTTEAGAQIGVKTAEAYLLCGAYDTAAFTDGIVRIRVYWSTPLPGDV